MGAVELDIDEKKKEFIIKGETSSIRENYRAKHFFLDFLKARFLENGEIVIPYDEDRELLLKKIQSSLEKYDIKQSDSPEIKTVLDDYYSEKENFRQFGEKARNIWNNQVDITEFQQFKECVERSFPKRTLYDKQLLAAFHLAFSQNSCNFSVPGAGKTSMVYAAYAYLKSLPASHPKKVNKLVIIGPLSSFGPWEDEYFECFDQTPTTKRLSGGVSVEDRARHLLSIDSIEDVPEITLMSYQSVANNLANLSHFLNRSDIKAMVVLDEAHKIKNVDGGVWASSVLNLSKLSGVKSRVVLTGTPIPNGYEDIYNLYEFIWPDRNIIDFNIFQLKEMSGNRFDHRVDQLIERISPFFIRIRKKDLNLPKEVNHYPVRVKMGKYQREIYEFIENKYIDYFESQRTGFDVSAQLVKARFVRLMQAASNPGLLRQPLETYYIEQGISHDLFVDDTQVLDKILRYYEHEKAPSKFVIVKDIISKCLDQGEKVIVWATFIRNIIELQAYLSSHGIASEVLMGEVPVETDETADEVITREKIIREFHKPNSKFNVIIANSFAVAESISLHKACHNAIYLERSFNAANFMQSKDRIHRVGLRPGTVTNYYYIISEDSIDETINHRLQLKEKRMIELIESQDIPLLSENLNYDIDLKDDLKAIIRDYVRRTTKA